MDIDVFLVLVDGKEIGKVPLGSLENFLQCVLKSVSSVNISLSKYVFPC